MRLYLVLVDPKFDRNLIMMSFNSSLVSTIPGFPHVPKLLDSHQHIMSSVAASVVGIFMAAAQISSVSIKFSRTVKNAPQQAHVAVTDINEHKPDFIPIAVFLSRQRIMWSIDYHHLC